MLNFLKNMSLLPKGLKYKTMIAFCLMSIIPLLICVWLVTTYIFPNTGLFLGLSIGNISVILIISVIISLLGLHVTEQMIDPIVKMAGDAKGIADGNIDKVIKIVAEDEVGDLGTSLNIMTQKIRDNIEELKAYGERTKLMNMEINKKVIALSSLLQIGNLIAASEELGEILNFISRKISDVENDSISFIMLLDKETGDLKVVSSVNLQGEFGDFSLNRTDLTPHIHVIDAENQG
ncbi:MAG: HAMP domain-containing protein, partial [Candidatus Omnitrophica bacterium]|nr:HAMP domain-containing protein [Candidatus Omnitrophota bacterium]